MITLNQIFTNNIQTKRIQNQQKLQNNPIKLNSLGKDTVQFSSKSVNFKGGFGDILKTESDLLNKSQFLTEKQTQFKKAMTRVKSQFNEKILAKIEKEMEPDYKDRDGEVLPDIIALTGNAKEGKKSTLEWVKDEFKNMLVHVEEVEAHDPREAMREMLNIRHHAKVSFNENNKRTVIVLKNAQQHLEGDSNRRFTNSFKSLTEDLSQKYKTTIIMDAKDTSNFDSAIKGRTQNISINDDFTKEDSNMLKYCDDKLEEIENDRRRSAREDYSSSSDDYNDIIEDNDFWLDRGF